MAALWGDCGARVRGYCWLCEGRCAFKSRPPLDPLIDIVLSQCMHCPAMTDIVPVENLCIGALHRTTQNHTEPHRTTQSCTPNPPRTHTEPHRAPHRPVDGQLVDERWSASTQQSNRRNSGSSSPGWIDASIMWSSGKRVKIRVCFYSLYRWQDVMGWGWWQWLGDTLCHLPCL